MIAGAKGVEGRGGPGGPPPPTELWPRGPRATAYRTRTCGELREEHAGKPAVLAGFVDKKLTDTTFVLRDEHGRSLVVVAPAAPPEVRRRAVGMTPESVIRVSGDVVRRMTPDAKSPTGAVYLNATDLELLSESEPLPPAFARPLGQDEEAVDLAERLRHRQLDLRRPVQQARLRRRALWTLAVRRHLAEQGFVEVETPLLQAYQREETQSYVAPARRDRAFSLASQTQRWKQLLVAGGVERYFQLARCFRREPRLTPERQPEYTILDLEMAYAGEADVLAVVEGLLEHIWRTVLEQELPKPIARLTYHEAQLKYGSTRPDLRFGLELKDVTREAKGAVPVAPLLEQGGAVRALRVPGRGEALVQAEIDSISEEAEREIGAHRTFLARVGEGPVATGPGADACPAEVLQALEAAPGDGVVLVAAPQTGTAAAVAGRVRLHVGRALELVQPGQHALCWVHRFPFYRFDAKAGAWATLRHPFTQPIAAHVEWLDDADKRHQVLTCSYDLVLDGQEVGAGSQRVHDLALQQRLFRMFGYEDEDVERRFGAALAAFAHGVPPHAGIAIGFDRLVALLEADGALADVIAFPKAPSGSDLLLDTPAPVDAVWATRFLAP